MNDLVIASGMNFGIAVLVAVLLVVIFRKAGFGWFHSVTAVAPVVGLLIQSSMIFQGFVTASEGVSITLPFALLPFLFLAFKSWPIAALPATSPETVK
jgi:hypothetical protein